MSRVLDLLFGLSSNRTTNDVDATNTPPQFDNDKSVATTAFVKTRGHEFAGVVVYNASQTLTAAHAGKHILAYQNPGAISFTLPTISTLPDGVVLSFLNASVYNLTLVRGGTDTINPANNTQNTLVLKPGENVVLSAFKSGSIWETVSGSASLAYGQTFANVTGMPGYQRMPGGVMMQWGQVTTSASADVAVTLPNAFDNGAYAVTATIVSALAGYACSVNTLSTTDFKIGSYSSATTRASATVYWIAIGTKV